MLSAARPQARYVVLLSPHLWSHIRRRRHRPRDRFRIAAGVGVHLVVCATADHPLFASLPIRLSTTLLHRPTVAVAGPGSMRMGSRRCYLGPRASSFVVMIAVPVSLLPVFPPSWWTDA